MIFDVAAKFNEIYDIRFIVVGLESAIIGFCAFYAANFYAKARMRKEYEVRNDMSLTWMIFFITQAIMNTLMAYANFFQKYIPAILSRDYILNIAGVIGLIGLLFIAKKSEDILKSYYIVTIILAIFCVFPIIMFYFPTEYYDLFLLIAYAIVILIFCSAVIYEIGDHPALKKQLKIFLIGFILMTGSQFVRSDFLLNYIFNINQNWVYNTQFLADWGILASLFILQYAYQQFPSLFELEWRKFLKELHIVHMKGGNEIFSYNFEDKNMDKSEITGGFMYGVNQLISEITGSSTPLNMIKQKENVIVFEKNEKLIIFLIASEYNEIYKIKLQNLLDHIMNKYSSLLVEWDNNLTPFKPLKEFIEKRFK